MKYFVTFLCIAFVFVSNAQIDNENTHSNSAFEPISEVLNASSIFNQEKPLEMSLKYDISSFVRHKAKEEYLDAELTIHVSEDELIKKNIRLKARGNFRKEYCFFPPIFLNFKHDPIERTDLEGIKKIKMVTHCSSSKAYEDYVLREYLAYRIYNILSDNSFRVKLVNIDYEDTGKKQRHYKRQGFLIEPMELLTKRNNAIEVEGAAVRGKDVHQSDVTLVALFHYMIGNTDWRTKGGHNMKFMKSYTELSPKVIPIPYDYDHAGFVGTAYAMPQEWTSLNSVRDREYLGYCQTSDDEYLGVIQHFLDKKEEIYEEINSFPYLDDKEKKRSIGFLEEFYQLAKRPEVLMGIMKRECRDTDF